MKWTLIRERGVVSYLYSLREDGRKLRTLIQSLENGIPEDADQIAPETWEWLQEYHWITFVVNHEKTEITITDIEKVEL